MSVDELLEVYEYELPSGDESFLDVLIREEKERIIREAVN